MNINKSNQSVMDLKFTDAHTVGRDFGPTYLLIFIVGAIIQFIIQSEIFIFGNYMLCFNTKCFCTRTAYEINSANGIESTFREFRIGFLLPEECGIFRCHCINLAHLLSGEKKTGNADFIAFKI